MGKGGPAESAMPPTLEELGLDRLDPEDRLSVAEAILAGLAREPGFRPLSAAQQAELERRLADSDRNPDAVTPWEVVRERAMSRCRG